MRILHTNAAYWPFVGGAETYLRAMSERLARDGHDVVVAATDATSVQGFWDPHQPRLPDRETVQDGVRVIRSPVSHLPVSPWSFYLLRRLATDLARLPVNTRPLFDRLAPLMPGVPALEQTLEQIRPGFDLVHGVNVALEWPLIAGWRYARRHGLPFVATPFLHAGGPTEIPVRGKVQRFYTMPHQVAALRDADRVIVQTGIEGQILAGLGVPQKRIVRLGMGVDLEETQGGDGARFRAQYGIDGPVVTFMGVLTDDKGIVHLLRAMQRLWRRGSDANVVIAGRPMTPSSFERAYSSIPEEQRLRTRRLGVVSGQLKQDMLAATDLFAMPSRVDSFGIVYLEAWAYGAPVIGCRAGGVPDVIDDGQDGVLVDYGDEAALASAIEGLLADPGQRRAMGWRGRAKVEARYTWDRIYRGLVEVYQELADADLNGRKGNGAGHAPGHQR
ncbi:MAG: glycosyltransferase family 4 protein [Anaerolineae bacterium]|nr:glycosyltransferase family 4 protein [Anaerolineae bacterium]